MVLRLLPLSLLFLFACSDGKPEVNPDYVDPGPHNVDGVDIRKMYIRLCVDCHGEAGDAGLMGASDLTTSTMSLEDRIDIITNGSDNGKMNPFSAAKYGELDSSEIEAMAKYIETLRK